MALDWPQNFVFAQFLEKELMDFDQILLSMICYWQDIGQDCDMPLLVSLLQLWLLFGIRVSHLMTKPTKWLCVQRRLRSVWASAQSDHSLLYLHEESSHWVHREDTDQTGRMPRLIWVFAGCTATLLLFSWGSSEFCFCSVSSFVRQEHSYCPLLSWIFPLQSISWEIWIHKYVTV